MIFKRLFWNVLIRSVLLAVNAIGLAFLIVFLGREDVITISLTGLLFVVQVIFLVLSLNKINRDLTIFFDSVYALDSSITFKDSLVSRQFSGLYEKMIKVNSLLGGLKIKLEEQNEYYKRITNQMPTSVISYFDDGRIGLINKAARDLFAVGSISNIKDLGPVNAELMRFLLENEESDQQLIKSSMNNEVVSLMIKLSSSTIHKKRIRIASIQNIESELGKKEIESWQSLLKVLTHEIANSIAPISSTIDTLSELSRSENEETYQDKIKTGLDIIGERSQGLLQLLDDIRRFSSFPPPKKDFIDVEELFKGTVELLKEELAKENINLNYNSKVDTVQILADKQLITHVLINLITNAKEALSGNKEKIISLHSDTDENGFVFLRVIDNGPGISKEKIDKILIPFYSTKESGSGIGLSISREIMRLHGGLLLLSTRPGKTEFSLKFQNPAGIFINK